MSYSYSTTTLIVITIVAHAKGQIILLASNSFFLGPLPVIATCHYCWKIRDRICNWIGSWGWNIGKLQIGVLGIQGVHFGGLRGCLSGSSSWNSGNLGFRECHCSSISGQSDLFQAPFARGSVLELDSICKLQGAWTSGYYIIGC